MSDEDEDDDYDPEKVYALAIHCDVCGDNFAMEWPDAKLGLPIPDTYPCSEGHECAVLGTVERGGPDVTPTMRRWDEP